MPNLFAVSMVLGLGLGVGLGWTVSGWVLPMPDSAAEWARAERECRATAGLPGGFMAARRSGGC